MDPAGALDRRFAGLYGELCHIARACRGRGPGAPDASALVHETYLRLGRRRADHLGDGSRQEFLGTVALAMKTVARDRRRHDARLKRGGGVVTHGLVRDVPAPRFRAPVEWVLALHEALDDLARRDRCGYAVLVHHDLLGFGLDETAELLALSNRAIRCSRRAALRWLRRRLGEAT